MNSEGLFVLLGVFLGAFIPITYNHFKDKRDRKDRYYFALLDKRFEVYQAAFNNVEKLKQAIHAKVEQRINIVTKIRDWYNENNLFLSPKLRKDYKKAITKTENYDTKLEAWKDAARYEDSDGQKKKADDLKKDFSYIMRGVQDLLQQDLDEYYKYIK